MTSAKVVLCASIVLAVQVLARPQATAPAAPSGKTGNVTLVKNDVTPLDAQGSFSYDIELSDGTKLMQSGHTMPPGMGETEPSIVIQGSYAYVAPDGKQISITYIADKNGFQPKGDSIPTAGTAKSDALPAAAPAPAATAAASSSSAAGPAAPPTPTAP